MHNKVSIVSCLLELHEVTSVHTYMYGKHWKHY